MTYTVPPGRYSDVNSAFVQAYIDAAIAGVIDLAPETLNSLNELAAAINDDPAFYATVASQVSELNTDVTALNAALGITENDSDVGTFSSPTLPDSTTLRAVLEAFASAFDATKSDVASHLVDRKAVIDIVSNITSVKNAVRGTSIDVGNNITLNPAAGGRVEIEGDLLLDNQTDVIDGDGVTLTSFTNINAYDGRLDTLEADPTTKTYVDTQDAATLAAANTYTDGEITTLINGAPGVLDTLKELSDSLGGDADFVTTMTDANTALSNRLDTLETDPTTQTYVDGINTALDARLDVLEADPTTQTLLDAETTARSDADTALSGRLDVLEADPTTQSAVDLKAPIADPTFTGDVSFGSLGRVNPSGNELKFLNDSMSSGIVLGNKITLQSNSEVEVFGDLVIESGLVDAADDTAASAAGVDVNQLYRNGSVVMIRVS